MNFLVIGILCSVIVLEEALDSVHGIPVAPLSTRGRPYLFNVDKFMKWLSLSPKEDKKSDMGDTFVRKTRPGTVMPPV